MNSTAELQSNSHIGTSTMAKVNEDLQKERDKCSFNIQEMIEFIDGGPEHTARRKKSEQSLLSIKDDMLSGVPDCYLSHKEKYGVSVRKAVTLFRMLRQVLFEDNTNLNDYRELLSGMLHSSMSHDGTPLGLHYMVFIPVLLSQADEEQQATWLPRAWGCSIIGTYAQTELGHGTFIRGLETTATYDPRSEEFVLHSPTLTSYKWWPGGLGHTANYCILIAQLYTKGECQGIHSFIVQLRDEETHMPLPGRKIGEIGAKMGLNSVNNGFLGFENVRIPRKNMLMRYAKVLKDGTYVKSRNNKLSYGGMVFVRVVIVYDMVNYLSKAVTIATRYSAVRRQCQIRDNEPEVQIIDYVTQQHKIFAGIAACLALKVTATVLWDTFNEVNQQLTEGNMDRLPELHALACCLKAVSTADTTSTVERCRLACGGHGYMHSSNLPLTYSLVAASCTYEGDNTVLLLQTARYLVKTWQQLGTKPLTPTVAYLQSTAGENFPRKWENSIDGIIRGFQIVAMRKISKCVNVMKKRVESGSSLEEAWNLTSVQLVAAAEAHCRVMILSTFSEEVSRRTVNSSPQLKQVLGELVELYTVYWAIEKVNDLLQFTSISRSDVEALQARYEDLLVTIRPNAVGLVDSFDIMDELLQSTLGSYDGRVYERLMEEALKSPLNQEPVNQSFHKYLKPFMQSAKL